ncbi:MAG: glycosyltransferase [Roseiflexaceae bacterium]|nr:glycosyltransferase [Roseiflexaceae bacterium]
MKIIIIAPGSRGDVQPYVALGTGLHKVGHSVSIMTTQDFQRLITDHGLAFVDMGGSAETAAAGMQALIEQGDLLKILASTGQGAQQMAYQAAVRGLEACQGADLIVGGLGGLFVGLALSEKLGIPFLQAHILPLTPTREFSSVLAPLPQSPLTTWANRLSHRVTQQMLWHMFRGRIRKRVRKSSRWPRHHSGGRSQHYNGRRNRLCMATARMSCRIRRIGVRTFMSLGIGSWNRQQGGKRQSTC